MRTKVKDLFEKIVAENFPGLVKKKTHKCRMQRKSQTRHFIIKMAKVKEKEILEA